MKKLKIKKLILVLSLIAAPILGLNTRVQAEEALHIEKSEQMSPADIQSSQDWYFAEGNTMTAGGKNLTTFILISNSNSTASTIKVTYMYNGGGTFVKTHTAPGNSKYSINTKNDVGLDKSFSIHVNSTQLVVAERAMYWDTAGESWTDGSTMAGHVALKDNWYFADGNTMIAGGKNFTTFFLIQNPNSSSMTATVTYAFASGSNVVKTHTIPANSKYSINAKNDVGLDKSFSATVKTSNNSVVERSMYWNSNGKEWAGGDTIKGTKELLQTGYSVFNSTYSRQIDGRTTFLLVYNPTNYNITFGVYYYFADSTSLYKSYSINSKSKLTINPVNVFDSKSFSAKIDITDMQEPGNPFPTQPLPSLVVEKSLYLNGASASEEWKGGYHQTARNIAEYEPRTDFMTTRFAEFNTQSAGGRDFYNILALVNTRGVSDSIGDNPKLKIFDSNGNVSEFTINVPSGTAKFVNLNALVPNKIFSAQVVGYSKVKVEKAIYWNSNGSTTGLHGSNGVVSFTGATEFD